MFKFQPLDDIMNYDYYDQFDNAVNMKNEDYASEKHDFEEENGHCMDCGEDFDFNGYCSCDFEDEWD